DAAVARRFATVAIPAGDQLRARLLARRGSVHVSGLVVRIERFGGPAGRQLTRGIALPVLALSSDLGDLDRAVALGDRAERSPRLDRLQLLNIADQHDLGLALLRFGQHALHLPRADHPGLV